MAMADAGMPGIGRVGPTNVDATAPFFWAAVNAEAAAGPKSLYATIAFAP